MIFMPKKTGIFKLKLFVFLLSAFTILFVTGNALSATITVTTNSDTVNASDGLTSFREAIEEANATSGSDRIIFSQDIAGEIIYLENDELLITGDLTIEGLGRENTTIDAQENSRVFHVNDSDDDNQITVSISGVTITGGYVSSLSKKGGAGIFNTETLFIDDCLIQENKVSVLGDGGAGIWNEGGTVTLSNSGVIYNNSSAIGSVGGGIRNYRGTFYIEGSTIGYNVSYTYAGGVAINQGNVTISNSAIVGNIAATNSKGAGLCNLGGTVVVTQSSICNNAGADNGDASISGYGGGVFNGSSGNMTLLESSVRSNSVLAASGYTTYGGGIANLGTLYAVGTLINNNSAQESDETGISYYGGIYNVGSATFVNSTISENWSEDDIGGILSTNYLELINCTVTGNYDDTSVYDYGGIVYIGTLKLVNSIVANTDGGDDIFNYDGSGTLILEGNNLVEDGSVSGVITGDPNLSALQDNGGPTLTHILLDGSIAINAGDNDFIATDHLDVDNDSIIEEDIPFDQRSSGYLRISGGVIDLGAVEVQIDSDGDIPPSIVSVAPQTGSSNVPINTSISAVFSESLDPTTINGNTFVLNNGEQGTVSYDPGTKTAIFIPHSGLAYATNYTVTITTEVKDLAGNNMASNYNWTFTTVSDASDINPAGGDDDASSDEGGSGGGGGCFLGSLH